MERVISIIKEFETFENVILSSFFHKTLLKAKKIDKRITTGVIFSCRPVHPSWLALEARSQWILLKFKYVDEELIENIHAY